MIIQEWNEKKNSCNRRVNHYATNFYSTYDYETTFLTTKICLPKRTGKGKRSEWFRFLVAWKIEFSAMILTGHFNALLFIRGIYRVFEQVPNQISNSHKIRILIRQIEEIWTEFFSYNYAIWRDFLSVRNLLGHPVVLCWHLYLNIFSRALWQWW